VALFNFTKNENHYHGDAPNLIVNADKANMSDNSIKVPALPDRTGFEIFKIVLTQILAVIGSLLIMYVTYIGGWNGKPAELDCSPPDKEVSEVSEVSKSFKTTPSNQLKDKTVTEKKS